VSTGGEVAEARVQWEKKQMDHLGERNVQPDCVLLKKPVVRRGKNQASKERKSFIQPEADLGETGGGKKQTSPRLGDRRVGGSGVGPGADSTGGCRSLGDKTPQFQYGAAATGRRGIA